MTRNDRWAWLWKGVENGFVIGFYSFPKFFAPGRTCMFFWEMHSCCCRVSGNNLKISTFEAPWPNTVSSPTLNLFLVLKKKTARGHCKMHLTSVVSAPHIINTCVCVYVCECVWVYLMVCVLRCGWGCECECGCVMPSQGHLLTASCGVNCHFTTSGNLEPIESRLPCSTHSQLPNTLTLKQDSAGPTHTCIYMIYV